jgi:hypothetical protein
LNGKNFDMFYDHTNTLLPFALFYSNLVHVVAISYREIWQPWLEANFFAILRCRGMIMPTARQISIRPRGDDNAAPKRKRPDAGNSFKNLIVCQCQGTSKHDKRQKWIFLRQKERQESGFFCCRNEQIVHKKYGKKLADGPSLLRFFV